MGRPYLLFKRLARELEAHLKRPELERQDLVASQRLPVLAVAVATASPAASRRQLTPVLCRSVLLPP